MSDDLELILDLKEAQDEIATLRKRLEQTERAAAGFEGMYKTARDDGFRAGIEAAYEVSGKYHQITHVREAIRALSPTDQLDAAIKQRDELAARIAELEKAGWYWERRAEKAESERDFEKASRLTSESQLGIEIDRLIRERDQALAASAAREIAMRDRAAETLELGADEYSCGCDPRHCQCSILREQMIIDADIIRALPISPDGQQALNDMLADAWDEGQDTYREWPLEKNPYRTQPSDSGKSEDRG